jgi:hypothetical protein
LRPNIFKVFGFSALENKDTLGEGFSKDSILLVLFFEDLIFLFSFDDQVIFFSIFGFAYSFKSLKFKVKLFHSVFILFAKLISAIELLFELFGVFGRLLVLNVEMGKF